MGFNEYENACDFLHRFWIRLFDQFSIQLLTNTLFQQQNIFFACIETLIVLNIYHYLGTGNLKKNLVK